MSDQLAPFIELLQLTRESDTVFVGASSNEPHIRAYGGLVAAQAISAANQTVGGDRVTNSAHAYFLRPGNPTQPVNYEVETIRNGHSFSTRRVNAVQNNKTIFTLNASFHIAESGIEHTEEPPPMTSPDELSSFDERFGGRDTESDMRRWFVRAAPFDIRHVDKTPFDYSNAGTPPRQQVWFKTKSRLPDEQSIHHAVFTYISDMTILDAILLRHGIKWTDEHILGASLDHAIWFHQPFRVDEWLLFDQKSPVATNARGLAEAAIWTRDGRRVATVLQEALLRPPHK